MTVETLEIGGFMPAIHGMRNPKDSWAKGDSYIDENHTFVLGSEDADLAYRLIKAGPEHCKFLRQIYVAADITAPLYVWSELDTYKVGTVADSTSKMHKLASTPITMECFETDDYDTSVEGIEDAWKREIDYCEFLRLKYAETKDKKYWKELIRRLPESWKQKRTWTANYAVLRNIYFQRKGHKLTEWKVICNWIETLPYADLLILGKNPLTNE